MTLSFPLFSPLVPSSLPPSPSSVLSLLLQCFRRSAVCLLSTSSIFPFCCSTVYSNDAAVVGDICMCLCGKVILQALDTVVIVNVKLLLRVSLCLVYLCRWEGVCTGGYGSRHHTAGPSEGLWGGEGPMADDDLHAYTAIWSYTFRNRKQNLYVG